MIKAVISFLLLTVVFAVGTHVVRKMNNQERWHLTKLLFFSTMCALAGIVVMSLVVVLF